MYVFVDEIYNETIIFWLEFDNHLHMSGHPKFKHFSQKYCPIFIDQMLKSLRLSQQDMVALLLMQREYLKSPSNKFIVDFRDNVQFCLKTVFKVISPEPYLNEAISMIGDHPDDYSTTELWLFVVPSMISDSYFPSNLTKIFEIILTFSPDACCLLIKTSCEFLKYFIDHFYISANNANTPEISVDSIYKWLAQVPVPASNVLSRDSYIEEDVLSAFISDCNEIEETPGQKDSTRVIYILTALSIIMESVRNVRVYMDSFFPMIEQTLDSCFEVISHFLTNEEVCEKTCDFMVSVIKLSADIHPSFEMLSAQLSKYYQESDLSCFINPLITVHDLCWFKYCRSEWKISDCKSVFDHSINFLSTHDSRDHYRLVERLMKLFRTILGCQYDDILHFMEVGPLLLVAIDGLLSEVEHTFTECYFALMEVFTHPTASFCPERPETKSIVFNLYHSHIKQIVKTCGGMLSVMNDTEISLIGMELNIVTELIQKIWKSFPDKIREDQGIRDMLLQVPNAFYPEARNLAALINNNVHEH
ncbi:hypothetical protein RF11_12710 [Thelohanellus kitauei]|uniref:Transportin-3 n=1 Tax=Thelohanellus kitauei TaxID=669202 RepID=A0A0C2MHW1_THEKT|nr:hypothetical protein RF11_12710 [Thelohanellus kitauei]